MNTPKTPLPFQLHIFSMLMSHINESQDGTAASRSKQQTANGIVKDGCNPYQHDESRNIPSHFHRSREKTEEGEDDVENSRKEIGSPHWRGTARERAR